MTLNVKGRGNSLYLDVDGRVHIDLAEVTFDYGQVQVVDRGAFQLLEFRDGRDVN